MNSAIPERIRDQMKKIFFYIASLPLRFFMSLRWAARRASGRTEMSVVQLTQRLSLVPRCGTRELAGLNNAGPSGPSVKGKLPSRCSRSHLVFIPVLARHGGSVARNHTLVNHGLDCRRRTGTRWSGSGKEFVSS
jgi:hypothetical protein